MRKNKDKKRKDLEQALLVLDAIDLKEVNDIYKTLPKPWKKAILGALDNSSRIFPLMNELIEKVHSTLHSA